MANNALSERRTAKASLRMRLGIKAVRRRPRVFNPDPVEFREYLMARDPVLDAPLPKMIARRFAVERWDAAGHQCVTIHPRYGDGRRHILYFHGGAFILPMLDVHWSAAAKLAERSGASVTVALYPVVPQSTREEATAYANAAFALIAEEWDAADIVLAGDSAGANMALTMANRRKNAGQPAVGGLLLYSPLLDLTLANPAIRPLEPLDCILSVDTIRMTGRLWAGDVPADLPELSPLYADPSGLPPTAIFQGTYDLFCIDARAYAVKARDAGAPVALYEYAGAPHAFTLFGFTPEAKDAFQLSATFIDSLPS